MLRKELLTIMVMFAVCAWEWKSDFFKSRNQYLKIIKFFKVANEIQKRQFKEISITKTFRQQKLKRKLYWLQFNLYVQLKGFSRFTFTFQSQFSLVK